CAGPGTGAGVEFAFLSRDGISQRLARAGDIGAGGDGAYRMGEPADIEPARRRPFPYPQGEKIVAPTLGHVGKKGELADARQFLRQRPIKVGAAIAMAGNVESADGF